MCLRINFVIGHVLAYTLCYRAFVFAYAYIMLHGMCIHYVIGHVLVHTLCYRTFACAYIML